ncbi:MAG TPA: PHP domain-containing protein [Candidatus Thermoplasmatota archaeon]|nr:PHP domain-containing protein [Candidatus Thermoplasmatota archaeon]
MTAEKLKGPDNASLAAMLEAAADRLELQQADPYRVRAYRKAALSVGRHPRAVAAMLAQGQPLTELPNVGRGLAAVLAEFVRSGKPPAPRPGRDRRRRRPGRTQPRTFIRPLLAPMVDALVADLRRLPGVQAVEPAGTYRRRADTVEGLDLVVACAKPEETLRRWAAGLALPGETDLEGTTLRITTTDRLLVAVRFVRHLMPAFVEATGSAGHVAALQARAKALRKPWPPSKGSEASLYGALGLPWVPPELREADGEVEAAAEGRLPDLVGLSDLKGDLHMHTEATDGASSVEVMAKASRRRGMEYVAITDHTQRTSIAGGLTPPAMREHMRRIDDANDQARAEGWGITILKGAEVDILRGGLDLPDDVLEEMDVVVCSLHHRDRQEGAELTRRVLQAMAHPKAHILGHPTGRLIGRRPGMDLDWGKVLDSALDHGWALEVDGQAYRMDPPAPIVRRAAALGVRFALDSDAHSVREMQFQENAVDQARRGWVERRQVLNAGSLAQMRARLRRR